MYRSRIVLTMEGNLLPSYDLDLSGFEFLLFFPLCAAE
jgi:hypothetical protein